ncbi:MAG: hypothetical protein GAK30_03677 [Paracidovorax wautersii]|uniref:Uncharacterized protein n=1 Tax=Paracidovorax wautersii TaxID=1177982 RepID=A0A7V8JNL3_9BURK|nr:MAG: hypothetical protein GAK30_03677 [Paracidovorax wautersii]
MMSSALLLTMMNPPAGGDDEFNDWADTEHIPERRAIPGIRLAQRFRNRTGSPRYMALYDLASMGVLESAAYRAIAGPNLSPWSKRILAGATDRWRFEGRLIHATPEPDEPLSMAGVQGVILLAWHKLSATADHGDAITAAVGAAAARIESVQWLRVYAGERGETQDFAAVLGLGIAGSAVHTDPHGYSAPGAPCGFAQGFERL